MRNKYLYVTLLAVLGFQSELLSQSKVQYAPRLVVSVTIDQLRTDYLEAFAPLYGNDGFKRLLKQGMVFYNAGYSFSPVDRASATASLATGVAPYYHSIVSQKWLSRENLCAVYCLGDKLTSEYLSTSTVSDELKVATNGKAKVYSIAAFDDAAILAAGHAANSAFFIDEKDGLWKSSSPDALYQPAWLASFNALHAPGRHDAKLLWEPLIEQTGTFNYYQHTESAQKPFKHKFTGADRYTQLKTSGLVNAYVTELAEYCLAQESMGHDRVTDLLSVTYYAGTLGHRPMSECQMELQDAYLRLDGELSALISHIEQRVGAEHVLFVVTSTGYSDAESADYEKYHIPTGTFYMNRTANLLNMYFGAIWGQGRYVEACFHNQVFLNHKLLESKRISLTDACQRAQEFLCQLSGVRNVYSGLQLLANINEQTLKIRNGYNPTRCGDILIEVSPGWKLYNEDNQDSQLSRASFIQFPIIFYGAGTKPERINEHVLVERIAPTIAKSIRIRAPNACSAEPLY